MDIAQVASKTKVKTMYSLYIYHMCALSIESTAAYIWISKFSFICFIHRTFYASMITSTDWDYLTAKLNHQEYPANLTSLLEDIGITFSLQCILFKTLLIPFSPGITPIFLSLSLTFHFILFALHLSSFTSSLHHPSNCSKCKNGKRVRIMLFHYLLSTSFLSPVSSIFST